jgi:hypothetical protein
MAAYTNPKNSHLVSLTQVKRILMTQLLTAVCIFLNINLLIKRGSIHRICTGVGNLV